MVMRYTMRSTGKSKHGRHQECIYERIQGERSVSILNSTMADHQLLSAILSVSVTQSVNENLKFP